MMSDPPVRVHRLARRLWRSAVAMLALIGFAFVVVAETPLPNLLVAPLLRIRSSPVKADIAVVLAGGRFTDGSLNQAALERTVAAVRLYHQGVVPLLMFTGGPCCGQSASALMADLAADLGVPRAAILVEEQSLRTRDSAVNVEALLTRRGLLTVVLVTSEIHLLRATLAFAAAGMSVHPVRASQLDLRLVTRLPERVGLVQGAVHEYLGLTLYWWRRWL